MLSGPAIIVSPLIALQRDQVESIGELEVGQAAQLNSTMRDAEREEVFQDLQKGKLNFAFCDGSVHSINTNIDMNFVMPALATIAGGEPIAAGAF